jgi:hypothetical protein
VKAMADELAKFTTDAFTAAQGIYTGGGNSKSVANLDITNGLDGAVTEGDKYTGMSSSGDPVYGTAYGNFDSGASTFIFRYDTTELQDSYLNCQVGGLVVSNTEGCTYYFNYKQPFSMQ